MNKRKNNIETHVKSEEKKTENCINENNESTRLNNVTKYLFGKFVYCLFTFINIFFFSFQFMAWYFFLNKYLFIIFNFLYEFCFCQRMKKNEKKK